MVEVHPNFLSDWVSTSYLIDEEEDEKDDHPYGHRHGKRGKIASQVAHAAILCYQDAQRKKSDHLNNWEYTGQMKVVLKCSDEAEFDRLYTEAKNLGLITSVVKDAGRTQIPHGTKTVVGIGPGPLEVGSLITEDAWDYVILAALPTKCSRHNTPSHAHSITKILQNLNFGHQESHQIFILCEKHNAFASGCAVARAYPSYSRKTGTQVTKKLVNVEFILANDRNPISGDEARSIEHAIFGIQTAARIVDTPCNEMHVNTFIEEVKNIAKKLGITPLIIQGKELEERGMGGIYGVGKAAENPPALVVLSHTPKSATLNVAWVGKGIVYDTGGLSIKGKTAMPGMKRDCGGAAGILGAFYSAVKKMDLIRTFMLFFVWLKIQSDLTQRDRTIFMYCTLKDLKADIIVDVCTLTGSQGVATGNVHAAFLTNNYEWESKTLTAGRSSGDLTFPLVYCPEVHFSEFNSMVADMKNSVADRSNATSSCAGLFINAHLGFNFPGTWLHVDMASPAYTGERATGYGVALLNTLFGDHMNALLLKNSVTSLKEFDAENYQDTIQPKKIKLSV
ncbi:NPEPL1 [Lepeophtheirus salmonis]|uniref:peptidyl-tRNA hydrolase n=1 Tax=Lepeophtheirus salmonis TaxID=72036 RepID=A0A7R8H908_LEPSM|nr:NPEPL1 [Lepeophtheirus salmonis]CAF2947478.1 NPEPL1 [Lepeophtheirus salmonis]